MELDRSLSETETQPRPCRGPTATPVLRPGPASRVPSPRPGQGRRGLRAASRSETELGAWRAGRSRDCGAGSSGCGRDGPPLIDRPRAHLSRPGPPPGLPGEGIIFLPFLLPPRSPVSLRGRLPSSKCIKKKKKKGISGALLFSTQLAFPDTGVGQTSTKLTQVSQNLRHRCIGKMSGKK